MSSTGTYHYLRVQSMSVGVQNDAELTEEQASFAVQAKLAARYQTQLKCFLHTS